MDDGISDKLFVVLCHRGEKQDYVLAKATSKVEVHLHDKRKKWVVWFQANEVSYFSKLTAIQTDNLLLMSYDQITRSYASGDFKVLGPLPGKFKGELVGAINASEELSVQRKRDLLKAIS